MNTETITAIAIALNAKGPIADLVKIYGEGALKGVKKIIPYMIPTNLLEKIHQRDIKNAYHKKHIEDIESGLITHDAKADMDLTATILNSISHNDQDRLLKSLTEVINLLGQSPEDSINDEPIEEDWFNKWRKEAEIISDEELRQNWSKLLVEEIKQPGSISIRTLNLFRNLTKNEAVLLLELAKTQINNGFLMIKDENGKSKSFSNKVSLENLMVLSDASLINPSSIAGVGITLTPAKCFSFENKDLYALFLTGKKFALCFKEEIEIDYISGSTFCTEILKIIDIALDLNYVREIAQYLKTIKDQDIYIFLKTAPDHYNLIDKI